MGMSQATRQQTTSAYFTEIDDMLPRRGRDTRSYRQVYSLTWQGCQEELARPNIDPAWRDQVELRLENIRRGSC